MRLRPSWPPPSANPRRRPTSPLRPKGDKPENGAHRTGTPPPPLTVEPTAQAARRCFATCYASRGAGSSAAAMHFGFHCLTCCIRDKPRALRAPCAVALRVPPPVVRCERANAKTAKHATTRTKARTRTETNGPAAKPTGAQGTDQANTAACGPARRAPEGPRRRPARGYAVRVMPVELAKGGGLSGETAPPVPPVDQPSISALPVNASTVRGSRTGSGLTTDMPAAFIRSLRAF